MAPLADPTQMPLSRRIHRKIIIEQGFAERFTKAQRGAALPIPVDFRRPSGRQQCPRPLPFSSLQELAVGLRFVYLWLCLTRRGRKRGLTLLLAARTQDQISASLRRRGNCNTRFLTQLFSWNRTPRASRSPLLKPMLTFCCRAFPLSRWGDRGEIVSPLWDTISHLKKKKRGNIKLASLYRGLQEPQRVRGRQQRCVRCVVCVSACAWAVPGTNVCFLPQGFEAAGRDTCWSPEEDNEQPSRDEGPVGEWDGAVVTRF